MYRANYVNEKAVDNKLTLAQLQRTFSKNYSFLRQGLYKSKRHLFLELNKLLTRNDDSLITVLQ